MVFAGLRGPALLLAASAMMSACAPVPNLGVAPATRSPEQLASSRSLSDAGGSAAAVSAQWPADSWWQAYGDAQLDTLIREALAASPDLAVATARLRQAQGYAQQAGAALLPSIDATGNAGYVEQSQNNGIPPAFVPGGWEQTGRVSIGFAFDPDLWGRNRAALAAAKSDEEAARYGVAEARLALTTAIASNYAELTRLHAQRAVLAATLTNREEALSLVNGRNRAGLDSDLALRQAQGRVPAARAELAATDEAIALTRNAIAALLGDGPDRALTITPPTLVVEQVRGVPADASIALIGRRPDIAAARAGVEAAASRIKVARAAFMPNISLSGLIGLQSLGFDQLFESGSRYGNAGAAITLPIFRGGALAGQYRGARGTYDEAVAHYDGTLVQALRQVADTMASRQALGRRLSETRLSLQHATEAHALARRRYEAGLSTYLDVLTAQDAVLQGQRAVADMETRAFALDVTMVRALGGGFTHS